MKTILFDLDGTIIDSTSAILEGFKYACEEEKLDDINFALVKPLIGYPLFNMFQDIGVPEDKIDNCIANYKIHYRKISYKQTILLKNAKKALILAKSFAKTCAVTTKLGQRSIGLLEHLGIWEYFDDIVGFDDVSKPKPDKESIILAMHKLKSNANKTWMIGDTSMDMQSAKSAGIGAIGVLSGYQNEEKLRVWTDNIKVDSLEAVLFIKGID